MIDEYGYSMDPRQYQRNDLRDVALIFGKTLLTKVTEVEVGDLLSIEATLLELGKRYGDIDVILDSCP